MTTGDFNPASGDPGGAYPPAPPAGAEPATLSLRFAARAIDGLIGIIPAIILAILVMSAAGRNYLYAAAVFFSLLTFIYFVAFESTQGWTPGKKLVGLSVRGPGGALKPTVRQSAKRNAFTLLTIVPYVGGLLALTAYLLIASTISTSPTLQGRHDQWAGGTWVVKGSRRAD
jgi:uncharacterized RDD family membrane protein YckC